MNCENCDNDIDYEYQVSEKINDLLRHYGSKDKVKEFLDNELLKKDTYLLCPIYRLTQEFKELIHSEILKLGYSIVGEYESNIEDDGQNYIIYQIELEQTYDYNLTLQQEKDISSKLELYKNNIILELY